MDKNCRNFMRLFQTRFYFWIMVVLFALLTVFCIRTEIVLADNYQCVAQWGSPGSGNGQFDNPSGVAVDSSGNVYVADTFNYRIQKFDSNGNYLTQWGFYGSGNGQFNQPFGVAVDSYGNVYVADSQNYRIQKFDSSGNYLMQWGSEGSSGNGQFEGLNGVTVDSYSNVYALDRWRASVQKFDSFGNYLTQWGSEGSGYGQFEEPWGAAVDGFGNVYVADYGGNGIQKFNPAPQSLTITEAGTGTGNVTPSAGTISWSGSTGTALYISGAGVTVTATADSDSTFTSWAGCDSTSQIGNSCTVTMTGNRNVTVTFALISTTTTTSTTTTSSSSTTTIGQTSGKTIQVGSSGTYSTIQSGYTACGNDNTIEVQTGPYAENDNFNDNVSVALIGGYDSSFSINSSNSIINGTLTISNGAVTVRNMIIQSAAIICTTAAVNVTVTDSSTGNPIQGTTVTAGTQTATTDTTGIAYFTGLSSTQNQTNQITISVTAAGYTAQTTTALLSCGTTATANVSLVPSTVIAGNVAKGPITGSTVNFFALNTDGSNGSLLGNTTTDSRGNYSVTMTSAPTAPFLAEASGGSYVNEVTGAVDALLSTDKLTAVLPAGATLATVTPLTHMAATRARVLMASGMALATAVDASNVGVAQQYSLSDILGTLPVAADDATQIQTANREQRNYGLVLAGITQEAVNLNVRPIDLAAALATDMEDGILDGLGSNPISVPTITGGVLTLPPTAGTAALQAAINTFIASGNNLTNLAGMSISTIPVNINPAGSTFYIAATALPAWTQGQSGSFIIPLKGGTPPYFCAVTQGSQLPSGMTLSQQGGTGGNWVLAWTPPLLVSGSTMSITAPFSVTCRDSKNLSQAIQWTATTVLPPPTTIPIAGACVAGQTFTTPVATATGGVPPYYFKSPSFAEGAPPLGTVVDLNGNLTGTCPAVEETTTYFFPVCAVDLIGADPCTTTSVTVTTTTTTTTTITTSTTTTTSTSTTTTTTTAPSTTTSATTTATTTTSMTTTTATSTTTTPTTTTTMTTTTVSCQDCYPQYENCTAGCDTGSLIDQSNCINVCISTWENCLGTCSSP
ncbi:MAG: hypothetical protein ABSB95_08930 [Dissulfurispiraceae bacterium]|jgi:hypothetical protein